MAARGAHLTKQAFPAAFSLSQKAGGVGAGGEAGDRGAVEGRAVLARPSRRFLPLPAMPAGRDAGRRRSSPCRPAPAEEKAPICTDGAARRRRPARAPAAPALGAALGAAAWRRAAGDRRRRRRRRGLGAGLAARGRLAGWRRRAWRRRGGGAGAGAAAAARRRGAADGAGAGGRRGAAAAWLSGGGEGRRAAAPAPAGRRLVDLQAGGRILRLGVGGRRRLHLADRRADGLRRLAGLAHAGAVEDEDRRRPAPAAPGR